MRIRWIQLKYTHVATILPRFTTHYMLTIRPILWESVLLQNRFNSNVDTKAEASYDSSLNPEYENKADQYEEQLYNILQKQTRDYFEEIILGNVAKTKVPANDTKERIQAKDADERKVPANDAEERIPANDAQERNHVKNDEECILANLYSDLGPRFAIPEAPRNSEIYQSRRHRNAGAVYRVLDGPRNVLEALQTAECDMWKGVIKR